MTTKNKNSLKFSFAQRGNAQQVFVVLLVLGVVMGTAIYWQTSRKAAARSELERTEVAARDAATAAKHAEDVKAQTEIKALEQQIEATKSTDVLQMSLKAADDLYARWKDGNKVANLTSRVGLATPVAALQALRREAETLIVPDCLKPGKTNLLEAMRLEIEGFLAFMGDVNFGKLVAQANADEAAKLLMGYEADRSMCPSSQKI